MHKFLVMALMGLTAAAQTQIDLATQAKRVDFSKASSTKPLQTGTPLPSACAVGQMFFKTDAPAGANLYACTATNIWSVQGGITGSNCWADASSQTLRCQDTSGNVYAVVKTATSGTANQWVDYVGTNGAPHTSQPTAAAVGAVADPGSNGVPYRSGAGTAAVAGADQLSGPFFCQDGGTSSAYSCSLTPAITGYSIGTTYWFRANTVNSGGATLNLNGLGPKAIVKQASQALAASDIRGGQWVMVTYDGVNMQMQSQTGNAPGSVSAVFGRTGAVAAQAGDYNTSQVTESGSLYFTNARVLSAMSGLYQSPITTGTSSQYLRGDLSLATFPTTWGWANLTGVPTLTNTVFGRSGTVTAQTGDYTFAQIGGSASAAQLPAVAMRTDQGNAVTAGTQDFSQAGHTLPMKSGTTAAMPSTCSVGETYFATDGAAGSNLFGCTASNVWSQQGGSSSGVGIKAAGTLVGTRNTLNIIPGAGIAPIVTDTGTQINIQIPIDAAVTDTRLNAASGADLLVMPASNSGTAYAGCPSGVTPPLTSGMVVHLSPDHNSTGGATTFNYCGTGANALVEADGATNLTSADLVSGRQTDVWYDGANSKWRLKAAATSSTATALAGGTTGAVPYQSAAGATAFLNGNTAATDQVLVSHGTGSAAAAPALSNAPALSAANMSGFPTLNQSTTGTASNVTGTVGAANGGTGLASPTAHGIMVAEGSSVMTPVTLAADTVLQGNAGADPAGASIPNCTGALQYSTATHTFSCGTLAFDAPSFQICFAAGCGSEVTATNFFISSPSGVTFDECGVSIATAPTGSSVIIDVQTSAGVSIFGTTKLVIPTTVSGTIFQSTFASSPQTAVKGTQFKAVVTQNDSGLAAQFAYVKCRVH